MTPTSSALLDRAELILSGRIQMPRGRGPRIAAILGRTALEDMVAEWCAAEGLEVGEASMRVKLACLRAVARSVAGEAALAWWGLSRACHQHAYEVAPHRDEVAHLVGRVRELATVPASADTETAP